MALSPSWAMSGQAIDAVGDPHLSKGFHYRVLTSPLLGLPVAPLVVGRISLGRSAKGYARHDVTWVDSHGTILTTPFTVTPDNPVTGYLPLGATCCWAMIDGEPGRIVRPVPGPLQPRVPSRIELPLRTPGPVDTVVRPPLQVTAPFALTGVVATPLGDAPVARRSRAPYHVYASHIERLVVSGSGTVRSVAWLPAEAVDVFERFRIAPLPIGPSARYVGPADGLAFSFDRVKRGAPQRGGMHEHPTVAGPAACPPLSVADEVVRVAKLAAELEPHLDRLVNDTTASPWELTAVEQVLDAGGNLLGTSDRLILYDLLQAMVDPGLARWLGLLDVDETASWNEEVVVAYVVQGLFSPDWDAIAKAGLTATLDPSGIFTKPEPAVKLLNSTSSEPVDQPEKLGDGPFLLARIVLAATTGVPLDTPSNPALAMPVAGPWLPVPPPAAVRELTVDIEQLVPGAGLGSAITQPSGGTPIERNAADSVGRRTLIVANQAESATSPTSGFLNDRSITEADGAWQVAQSDWFGRWSGWSRVGFGPGVRPVPPRPTLTLTVIPPVVPQPAPSGPLAGKVRVEVSVPALAGLPAGARLLDHLELTTSGGATPGTASHPIADPTNPPETLVIEVAGPALAPTASGTVTVTALWRDVAGVASATSEPKTATLYDPRPPTPVVLPPTLDYTARPDSTGRARATLSWQPVAGQAAFRVFVADETTLRAKLEDVVAGHASEGDAGLAPSLVQAQTLLNQLAAAGDDAPARGAVWDANRHLLPRRWWLQLTGEPVPAPPSGPVVFHHDVSGSLVVLVLYRVVAVSAASVETDFATSPLLPRGVPNLLRPPEPTLAVRPVVDGAGNLQAELTITVPPGPTAAARYRLRRATTTTETLLMPVVGEGVLPPRTSADQPQVLVVADTGDTVTGPRTALPAWVKYHWRVEVQGAPAPGGGPPGEWSTPSAPASTVVLPPDPPVGVTDLTTTRDAAGVHVRFRQPEPLAGGATTGYAVDVYRQLPGAGLRLLTSVPGQAPSPLGRGDNPAGFFDVVDADATVPTGTGYRVVITDPIGRMSAPSALVEAP